MPNSLPTPKPGILSIAPYVGGKSKAGDKKVIKLSSNESPLGASPKAIEAYKEAAASLHRYPDGGFHSLREAIASAYGLDASRIVCGAGSDELIGLLVHAYAGVGDEVLFPQHGFLMYKIYAQSFGATPVTAPERNLRTDIEALLEHVTDATKIVFLANPNNPTGSYISTGELAQLRNRLPGHVLLVVDAAYAEYVSEKDYSDGLQLASTTPNTVMLRTFSKIHGLSALRLGWGYFPAEIADVLNRIRGPFNVNAPAQIAGAAAIADTAHLKKCIEHNNLWLEELTKSFTAIGIKVWPSVANFLLLEFAEQGKTANAANAFLLERGIILREVAAYGLPNHLRMTLGTAEENKATLTALTEFMNA